jgi:hypothetical protein
VYSLSLVRPHHLRRQQSSSGHHPLPLVLPSLRAVCALKSCWPFGLPWCMTQKWSRHRTQAGTTSRSSTAVLSNEWRNPHEQSGGTPSAPSFGPGPGCSPAPPPLASSSGWAGGSGVCSFSPFPPLLEVAGRIPVEGNTYPRTSSESGRAWASRGSQLHPVRTQAFHTLWIRRQETLLSGLCTAGHRAGPSVRAQRVAMFCRGTLLLTGDTRQSYSSRRGGASRGSQLRPVQQPNLRKPIR